MKTEVIKIECKWCAKIIKGKPVIWHDYYFCQKEPCLGKYIESLWLTYNP